MQYIGNVPATAMLDVRHEIDTGDPEEFERALEIIHSYTYFEVVALMNDINASYNHGGGSFVITYQNHLVVALMDNSSTLVKSIGYDTENFFDLGTYVDNKFP